MNDEHELGYEEPSQAEKIEKVIKKIGVIVFALCILCWFLYELLTP
jgi:hypothetical protein